MVSPLSAFPGGALQPARRKGAARDRRRGSGREPRVRAASLHAGPTPFYRKMSRFNQLWLLSGVLLGKGPWMARGEGDCGGLSRGGRDPRNRRRGPPAKAGPQSTRRPLARRARRGGAMRVRSISDALPGQPASLLKTPHNAALAATDPPRNLSDDRFAARCSRNERYESHERCLDRPTLRSRPGQPVTGTPDATCHALRVQALPHQHLSRAAHHRRGQVLRLRLLRPDAGRGLALD
jgi:hypothetical protein